MWGERLQSEKDVWSVFHNFITGAKNEHGVKVSEAEPLRGFS
jgi:hypothetical protein